MSKIISIKQINKIKEGFGASSLIGSQNCVIECGEVMTRVLSALILDDE